jgi:hypothetical protein
MLGSKLAVVLNIRMSGFVAATMLTSWHTRALDKFRVHTVTGSDRREP